MNGTEPTLLVAFFRTASGNEPVRDWLKSLPREERLEAVLKDADIPTRRFAARETNHSKLNENLGLPEDPPTKALFEFVDEALKK